MSGNLGAWSRKQGGRGQNFARANARLFSSTSLVHFLEMPLGLFGIQNVGTADRNVNFYVLQAIS